MRHLPLLLIITLCLAVMTGCRHEYDARLIHAEEMMFDHPDSALAILEDLDSAGLHGGDLALYALLKTEAQEKLYMDPVHDSLIQIAVEYFDDNKEFERSAKAHYYQGRVRCYRDTLAGAIVSFFKAREIADQHNLSFWAGQACRGISDVAWSINNAPEAQKYASQQLAYFRQSGRQPFLNFGICEYALSLNNAGNNEEAILYAREALDSADVTDDRALRTAALEVLGYAYLDMKNFNEAQEYLSIVYNDGSATTDDSIYYGMAVYWGGDEDRGRDILSSVKNGGTIRKNSFLAQDYAYQKNYKKAYEENMLVDSVMTGIIKKSFNNTITSNLDSYFSMEQQKHKLLLERERLRLLLVVAIACLMLLVVTMLGIAYRRRKQREIDRKILIAEDLQEALERTQYNYDQIQSNYKNLQLDRDILNSKYNHAQIRFSEMKSAYDQVQRVYERIRNSDDEVIPDHEEPTPSNKEWHTLVKGRFEILDVLTHLVTQNRHKKNGRQKIADFISQLVSDFSEDHTKIKDMEDTVDRIFDNLMTDFKETFQGRKDADYKLFLFSVIGLSNDTIAEFLKEESIESVYTRRKRLKRIIRQAPEAVQIRFIPYL